MKLLEHLSARRGPSTNLRSYLYEMAYHLVIDEVRYSYRAAPIEVVDLGHHDPYSTYLSFEERILFETARRAIQKDLSAGQRHVIILRCLEGFSLKEQQRSLEKKWVT